MYHLIFAQVVQADREREIEAAVRRRRLLRPDEESSAPLEAADRRPSPGRVLPSRVRTTGG